LGLLRSLASNKRSVTPLRGDHHGLDIHYALRLKTFTILGCTKSAHSATLGEYTVSLHQT